MSTADKQPTDRPSRDERGRFLPGHRVGFQPGQSGNPAGRPRKGDAWADIISEIMEQEERKLTEVGNSIRSVRLAIVRRIALLALKDSDHHVAIRAAQWLADRESGRPGQRVAIEDTEGNLIGPIILPPVNEPRRKWDVDVTPMTQIDKDNRDVKSASPSSDD